MYTEPSTDLVTPLSVGQSFFRGAIVLWVAVTLVFFALRIVPGDGISATLRQSGASEAQIESQRRALCLDCPIIQQYGDYLVDIGQGEWGFSTRYQLPVQQVITSRLEPTLSLGMAAFGTALIVGTILGVFNGLGGAILQRISDTVIVFTQAVPVYLTAVFAIYIFSLYLDMLPAVGTAGPEHLLLPAVTLGFHVGGSIARVFGISLRETFSQPFMLTARAKGLPPIDQLDHALRIAILPILSVLVIQAGFLLGGTVIVEFIFVRRGLGSLLRESVIEQDYAVVQALVLISALIYLSGRSISSILRYMIDPRLCQS